MSRKNDSGGNAIIELAALLPWWGGVTLAVVSYGGLGLYLRRPVPPMTLTSGTTNPFLTELIVRGFASFGQIVLPMLFLFGAVLSGVRRWQRRKLIADVAQGAAPDALNGLTWREFEMLVGEAFRTQGYAVTETGGSADGGVDIVLRKDGEKYFVQCKQWRATTVGVPVVRELYGAMAAHGATGGFVVTSGRYTRPALDFAHGRNLTLIDGPQLHAMVSRVPARPDRPQVPGGQTSQ